MKKTIVFLLTFGLLVFTTYAGTFYVVKGGEKSAAGTYNSQKEFVQIMKQS